jgi:putative oxidoreductase
MHPLMKPLAVIARVLLVLIFVLGGIGQFGDIARTSANMASHGIPYPNILVWGVVALEVGGGLMLIIGLLTRLVALAFFFYTLALAVIFHPYWMFAGQAARTQHGFFYGHLAIMGGMLLLVVFGAGPCSMDALIWGRRTTPTAPAAPTTS